MQSNFILINQYKEKIPDRNEYKEYLIIGFRNTILIMEKSLISIMQPFLSINNKITIYSLCEIDNIKIDHIINEEDDKLFQLEMNNFNDKLQLHRSCNIKLKEIWNSIIPCISGYLIKESYEINNKINRIEEFIHYEQHEEENSHLNNYEIINENKLIELRYIDQGTLFIVKLFYHIEQKKLMVKKKANCLDDEIPKLIQREIDNYSKINHPFLSKFIGTNDKKDCIFMEFINGCTLDNINDLNLSYKDKINIIFEVMLAIDYLHRNDFIYRDLKPNNIMIDKNKTAVLIDFDRMISFEESVNPISCDFSDLYCPPEINSGNLSYNCDSYSLAKVIYYIIERKNPTNENIKQYNDSNEISFIKGIVIRCIYEIPEKRYSIEYIIGNYFLNYYSEIEFSSFIESYINILVKFVNNEMGKKRIFRVKEYSFIIGFYYNFNKFIPRDINKSIHYLELAANQNYSDAQFNLGCIYNNDMFIPRDINKSIHYLELAANQNNYYAKLILFCAHSKGKFTQQEYEEIIWICSQLADQNNSDAQHFLGVAYFQGTLIPRNINKSIHYLTLSANQNNYNAQYILGYIYGKGELVPKDINKSIHYLTLAANQNYSDAQYSLGYIYAKGELVPRDINKSIHYLTLAANQSNYQAQLLLGIIYLNNKLIPKDINKSNYYLKLVANKNSSYAKYALELIHSEGKIAPQDYEKLIYVGTYEANQNISESQYILGKIYYEGIFVPRDIFKSIHYLTLASNQNNSDAQYSLGVIYYEGKLIAKNINKSIHYLTLASNQNNSNAQYYLGFIYYENKLIPRDIDTSIHFLTLAAEKNNINAQFLLSMIYLNTLLDKEKGFKYLFKAAKNGHITAKFNLSLLNLFGICKGASIKKGLRLVEEASENELIEAHCYIGLLYHFGDFCKQDITKAINYYKKASSFNFEYAKNNLGIIYKHGFKKEINKNVEWAIEYFEEAIRQKNDYLSMYNLAHLHFYEEPLDDSFEKSIHLLLKSTQLKFYPSIPLLCLVSAMKFGYELDNIISEINKIEVLSNLLKISIRITFYMMQLEYIEFFEYYYNIFRDIDYVYNYLFLPTTYSYYLFNRQTYLIENKTVKDIDSNFYEGFYS